MIKLSFCQNDSPIRAWDHFGNRTAGSLIYFLNLWAILILSPVANLMHHPLATKNDSKAQFFRLRNIIFETLTIKTKNLFKEIRDIAVTLDKVTVQRSSYTVIMTYIFRDGKKLI